MKIIIWLDRFLTTFSCKIEWTSTVEIIFEVNTSCSRWTFSSAIIEEAIEVAGYEEELNYKPVFVKMLKPRRPGIGLENVFLLRGYRKFMDWDELTNPISGPDDVIKIVRFTLAMVLR